MPEGAQWVGPRTQNPGVSGSIPGSRRSFSCHFFAMVGSLFIDFRTCWDHFGFTFWSRRYHFLVMSGSLLCHVGITCSSFLVHVGICFGRLWGGFRIGLGRFGQQVPPRSKNQDFQTCLGVFVLRWGAQNNCV